MAWLRIEDTVPEHRKHLQAGAAACWLWVCGIAYCQRQLSDGFIPDEALPLIGVRSGAMRLADKLTRVGLFDRVDGGYRVHDYHDYNDTKDEALIRKDSAREQRRQAGLASGRSRRGERNVNGSVERPVERVHERPLNPDPTRPDPTHPEKKKTKSVGGVGSAPLWRYPRFAVFRWMVDDLLSALGPAGADFDLDGWFITLSAGADRDGVVITDAWKFIKAATLAEAQRRGLPLAASTRPSSRLTEDAASMDAGVAEILRKQGVIQ